LIHQNIHFNMPAKKKVTAKKTTRKSAKAKPVRKKKIAPPPSLLRGFRDILPEEAYIWDYVTDTAREFANDYSYKRIRLPILEKAELFDRAVGDGTDIVEKEMFNFKDQGDDHVALRPEATAQIARAYIEHGMLNRPQPVKMWYMEQMFRYERPQKGRYRQFWQFGFEAVGSDAPIIDAQIMLMVQRFLKQLGLDVIVKVNSIGTFETRKEYTNALTDYFKGFRGQLSDVDKKRLKENPLRLLDSKEEGMAELKRDAPQIIDWIDDDSKDHFMKVLEYLSDSEVPYELDPFLVRGLDYYGRTVFEVVLVDDNGRSQNAIAGGGRYDDLLVQFGAREEVKGAMGAAIGIERVVNALKDQKIEVPKNDDVQVFFAQLGEGARRKGMLIFEELRAAGFKTAEAFGKGSLKTQLEMADKRNARITLILGQKEVLDGTIIVRDMESGGQEIVDSKKVVSIVKKTLK